MDDLEQQCYNFIIDDDYVDDDDVFFYYYITLSVL